MGLPNERKTSQAQVPPLMLILKLNPSFQALEKYFRSDLCDPELQCLLIETSYIVFGYGNGKWAALR